MSFYEEYDRKLAEVKVYLGQLAVRLEKAFEIAFAQGITVQ